MTRKEQMKQHELWALWWIHAATNGHAETRTIHKGGYDGPLLNKDELRDEAMKTAKHHIHCYREVAEGE